MMYEEIRSFHPYSAKTGQLQVALGYEGEDGGWSIELPLVHQLDESALTKAQARTLARFAGWQFWTY